MIKSIPHKHENRYEYYAYWEHFLSDDDINLLLGQPEWANMNIGRIGAAYEADVNLNTRSSLVCWAENKPELAGVWEKITCAVAEVNSKFFHFALDGFYEPMQLSSYAAEFNGHYNWHVDTTTYSPAPRKLSMALMLSDPSEFTGGELEIKPNSDESVAVEQKRGRAWFFPSYTLHRVAPVTSGERKSLVLWAGGPAFK